MPGIIHILNPLPDVHSKCNTTMSAEDIDNGDINNNDGHIEPTAEQTSNANENIIAPAEGSTTHQQNDAANSNNAIDGQGGFASKVKITQNGDDRHHDRENLLNGNWSEVTQMRLEKFDSCKIISSTPFNSVEAEGLKANQVCHTRSSSDELSASDTELMDSWQMDQDQRSNSVSISSNSEVNVITGNGTLSAVICLEEGLADDDSWVEELDQSDLPECQDDLSESSDFEDIPFMEEIRYNHPDFTLHTIYEESGEESGAEEMAAAEVKPTELEKYFVFEIGGSNHANSQINNEPDSISESSSTISEDTEAVKENSPPAAHPAVDLIPSRLEKYFLSGFMGFHKRDSDGSVGSDSEGKQSPEQRRRKVIRARSSNRHSSLDNLNEEQQLDADNQYESSDGDSNEEDTSFDKSDGQFDTVKRTKKKKRSVIAAVENTVEEVETTLCDDKASGAIAEENTNRTQTESKEPTHVNSHPVTSDHALSRKDSFNNWSSDEETNLMMSKMRTFFKTMIAQQKKVSSVVKTKNKPPQLVYFESELTRLMKTVPGIRDDQVKEIVEYLSSEDTWSDSYDSSDYTSSDLDVGSKKNQQDAAAISVDSCKVPDINMDGKKNLDLVYHCLMSSFQTEQPNDVYKTRNSPPLMNKVMQHIGSRLVALMHEVSEGSTGTPKSARNQRRVHNKLPSMTTLDDDDSAEDRSPLPRSKSYDPLMEEGRQEASDNERFSWRGSFESALMTGSDSRTRLPSTGETSASALALAAAKRRSAGDLLFKSANNSREHLDRVRSCGSIGGGVEDKIWSMRHVQKRRSSVPEAASNSGESADGENDTDDDEGVVVAVSDNKSIHETVAKSTTLPRTLQNLSSSTTNSLPRLSSSPTTNIYKVNNSHQFGVKSARYRPPGYNARNTTVGSFHTLSAPPRRDYNRRRYSPHILSVSALSSGHGTGDDCSVASDISERTGILDNESEKSHSRTSTVSVSRSDSMASVYSGAGEGRYGVVPVRGEVEFSLQYNYKSGDVEIHVKKCSDLSAVDTKRNRSDPYVKVYLLPDKSKSGKRKTRVKKHTLNPVFDEVLKYHISLEELESRTLWLSVWHSDIFGRNDFLGEVVIPLVNKIFDDPIPKVYMLKERSEILDNVSTLKGELIVALKFILTVENKGTRRVKETGSLHVLIKEAKNLTAAKSNGTSDPFCKSYLLPNKGRSCKQKTPVLKRTCHPVWNHTFTYNNVTLDELSQRCLELTIWDHDRLASNEFLGGIRLSLGTGLHNDKPVDWMDSNNREVALWQKMLDHPNFWVESSLILRPSLDGRDNKI